MNVYDTTRMQDALAPQGYQPTEVVEEADLILLNTCHIREKAAEKMYSDIGRMKDLKIAARKQGRTVMLGVAGCVAQAEGREIVRRAPAVDMVFGPQSYHRLPDLLSRAQHTPGVVETDFPEEDKFSHLPDAAPQRHQERGPTAFLTVQEGCDKFCTFCVVPYTRGAEVSRPMSDIFNEAQKMVAAGVREITLLGQNVNAYHSLDDSGGRVSGLPQLLYKLSEIPGLARLRYTTSHLRDMTDDLIAAHRDLPQLMPYLHLPVQAGSDHVLAKMNRQHTADEYKRMIEKVRRARPDIALSGDFIVGFPGETDADFQDTLALVRDVTYASSYSFKYSPRPGTPASDMDGQVPEPVKVERLNQLQTLLAQQQDDFNRATLGRTVDVLLEREGRKPGQLMGRSPYLQPVHIDATYDMIGSIVPVLVNDLGRNSLFGVLGDNGLREPDKPAQQRMTA